MHGVDSRTKASESAPDVHQARVVSCRTDLGLGVEDASELVREHSGGGVRVLDGERPAEPATLLGLGELHEVDAPHVPQELQWRIPDLQHPQRVACRMISNPVRIIGADVGDAESLDQELGELEDPGAEILDPLGETRVPGQFGGHGIQFAHHAHAGARGCDDGLVTAEDLDETPHQRYRLALVARVEVHLPAARLCEGKVHLHPETLENLHGGTSRLGEERVVEAGYKERHAHRYLPFSLVPYSTIIDHSGFSQSVFIGLAQTRGGLGKCASDVMLGFTECRTLLAAHDGCPIDRYRGDRLAMEEYLVTAVGYLRLVVEAIGAAVVGFGVLATTYRYVLTLVGIREYTYNEIRLYLGGYLVLGLEFQLGADILSTAVAPTLDDVILLGAIATIRTALNYFLSQELARERQEESAATVTTEQRGAPG